MLADTIRVLMIEDNMGDARLISEMIKEVRRVNIKLEHSLRLTTGLERLSKGDIDVVLLDLGLPDSTGLDSLKKVGAVTSTTPVVVLTGFEDEEIGLKAVQLGAQDYLIKLQIDSNLLVRCLLYAIERKKMDQKLLEKEKENQAILDVLPDLIFQLNKDGMFLSFKGSSDDIFPARNEYIGKSIFDYYPAEIAEKTMNHLKVTLRSYITQVFEYQLSVDNIIYRYESRMVLSGKDKVLVIVRNVDVKNKPEQIEKSSSSFE